MSAQKLTHSRVLRRPAHRFLRNPNVAANLEFRNWSRTSCYDNTLKVLEDPESGRKVYLIGTTHGSTTLANRTKRLIQEIQPDTVIVQTSEEWAERAALLDVSNQRQMTALNREMRDLVFPRYSYKGSTMGSIIFEMRYFSWLYTLNFLMGTGTDFHPLQPGLEVKYACESAQQVDADIEYLGTAFDQRYLDELQIEKRLNFFTTYYNYLAADANATYNAEHRTQLDLLYAEGPESYAESIDDETASWWIAFLRRMSPIQKKLMIERQDARIAKALIDGEGQNIVAVVNQWHLPGVEAAWRFNTSTEEETEPINPIGDMDINAIMEADLQTHLFYSQTSQYARTEPASSEQVIVQFTDTTHEHERARHVFFTGYDDPEMSHGLWLGENEEVEYYEHKGHGHH